MALPDVVCLLNGMMYGDHFHEQAHWAYHTGKKSDHVNCARIHSRVHARVPRDLTGLPAALGTP
jgi:hypothetical protein